ncbi:MAG: efflux RND transporter periplasmic adaptor subunit [Desulfobacterales bacterium]
MRQTQSTLLLLILLLLLPAGCGDEKASDGRSPEGDRVVQAPVATVDIAKAVTIHDAVGTVKAKTASTISSKVVGRIMSIHVETGDEFKKGDLLLVIDPRQVSAQLQQAEAGLAESRQARAAAISARNSAKVNAKLAKATYDRYVQLMTDASASQQEFDEIKAKHHQAEASLTQAEAMVAAAASRIKRAAAAVSAAKISHQDATIHAPYNGMLTAKMVDEGDLATPGMPLLALEGISGYRVDTVLPEEYIHAISLNQKVRVTIDASKGGPLDGTIQAIAPAADDRSHSFLVKVAIPEESTVLAGMFARVAIPVGTVDRILIPAEAVIRHGQLTGLFLLNEDRIAKFRLIRTGRRSGESVEVISGLRKGDRYVAVRIPGLVDGTRVEANP